jgi:eukaryotic-like serine/threonine-protein kinase
MPTGSGARLGPYVLGPALGAGGMGEVYRAHDSRLGRDVAIKILPPDVADDPERLRRFESEARAAAVLNHPNILTVFDVGRLRADGASTSASGALADTLAGQGHQDEIAYLVTELLEGRTLRAAIDAGAVPLPRALDYAVQIAEGLAAAHAHGIVHRDLKPENVFVTTDGRVKSLDFGLARTMHIPDAAAATLGTRAPATAPHVVLGTPGYMAPEQVRGEPVDQRADVFAFGCVLYELLGGRPAFGGGTTLEILSAILRDTPAPLASPACDRIVAKALEKDPTLRYQSAADLRTDLERLKRDLDPSRVVVAPSPRPRKRWLVVAAAVAAAAVLAATAYVGFFRSAPLTEQDTILLADFTNTTGDPVFDSALKSGLAVQLAQSPFLNIFPQDRVQHTLRLMDRPPDEPVQGAVGREICERQNIKALLAGSIGAIGTNYVVTLDATNCATGASLALEQVEAKGKEDVLTALGTAATRLRRKLGESLNSIQQFDKPLPEVTTSSLEALRAYGLAMELSASGKPQAETIPVLRRAIDLDPNFAIAHAGLASTLWNLGRREEAATHGRQAYGLRERTTEREKLIITAAYYFQATGEYEKAVETYEVMARTYPLDFGARLSLGVLHRVMGRPELAPEQTLEAMRLNPDHSFPGANLAFDYIALSRFEGARETCEQHITRFPSDGDCWRSLHVIAFEQGDVARRQELLEWSRGKPIEASFVATEGAMAAFEGKLRRSRELRAQAVALHLHRNERSLAAQSALGAARIEAELGYPQQARAKVAEGLRLGGTREVLALAASVLADLGDADQALAHLEAAGRAYPPTHHLWKYAAEPQVLAHIESLRGNPAGALEILEISRPYELERGRVGHNTYVRGKVYLQMKEGQKAAAEFQKILDHPGLRPAWIQRSLAHLYLGRAHSLAGKTVEARTAYEAFLALWKDADPDIPILLEARAEYARL